MGDNYWGAASYVYSGEEWKTRTKSRSEMQVWTVSQKFSHPQWRRPFEELWCRPTTTADFRSSFRQIPYGSNLCLLEDKVQDRGMYLFTISYGSDAMDQGSGDGFSVDDFRSSLSARGTRMPDFEVLDAKIASALNRVIHNTRFRNRSVWRKKKPKKKTVAIVEDRSLTWSTSIFGSQEPTILSRILPTYLQLFFEWRYSGIRFEMGRNSIINNENPIWWHLGMIVQSKNTRVW